MGASPMATVPTSTNNQPHGADEEPHAHPTERNYIKIGAILFAITLIEVIIYYVEAIEGILVPALIALSLIKFIMVVGYFMHLKFDDSRLRLIFIIGMVFALGTFIGLWVLQHQNQITEFISDVK
jgi:cytochrome c oxidase subunit 4